VKISNKKNSFFSTRNQYFPHIPYVASKKYEDIFGQHLLMIIVGVLIKNTFWRLWAFEVMNHAAHKSGIAE
jgi:hypothetical protein